MNRFCIKSENPDIVVIVLKVAGCHDTLSFKTSITMCTHSSPVGTTSRLKYKVIPSLSISHALILSSEFKSICGVTIFADTMQGEIYLLFFICSVSAARQFILEATCPS